MSLVWMLVGCPEPIVVPPVEAPPLAGASYVPPCCTISDGPWVIEGGSLDSNGDFSTSGTIGRIWAYNPTADLDGDTATKDWYEYAERKDTVWYWPASGKPWRVHVDPLPAPYPPPPPPAASCLVSGYQACQEFKVFTTTLSDPGQRLLPARVDVSLRVNLSDYFAAGKYRVRAYFTGTTTPLTAWLITKGGNNRQEVFCYGSGFSWPRRAASPNVSVDWVIDYSGPAPSTLPTTAAGCGNLPDGGPTVALSSDAIQLL